MANQNPNNQWNSAHEQKHQPDAIDLELDAALAKYSAVEPRSGLEERVLAHLRAEHENVRELWWRRWMPFAVTSALAATIIVAAVFAWRLQSPRSSIGMKHSPVVVPTRNERAQPLVAAGPAAKNPGHSRIAVAVNRHRVRVERTQTQAIAVLNPKLDQFPSRQPMSEQEAALIHYVKEFPAEAALIAQGQDEYEKEVEKRREAERAENESSGSDLRER